MNCNKCGVDLRGIKEYKTQHGLYCEYCYRKYIMREINPQTDSFVTHLRQIPEIIEIFSVNDLW